LADQVSRTGILYATPAPVSRGCGGAVSRLSSATGGYRMTVRKRGRGRPPVDPRGAKEARIHLRLLPWERTAWGKAAAQRALSLSDWAREHLNRAAKREAT
jgi:hypothetical protein